MFWWCLANKQFLYNKYVLVFWQSTYSFPTNLTQINILPFKKGSGLYVNPLYLELLAMGVSVVFRLIFLPLHTPVLKPDFDVALSEI